MLHQDARGLGDNRSQGKYLKNLLYLFDPWVYNKNMAESSTIIVLLTITVILLSVVIVALLATITVLILRVNRIAKNVEKVSGNVAEATEWLSPVKLFSTVVDMFKR